VKFHHLSSFLRRKSDVKYIKKLLWINSCVSMKLKIPRTLGSYGRSYKLRVKTHRNLNEVN